MKNIKKMKIVNKNDWIVSKKYNNIFIKFW